MKHVGTAVAFLLVGYFLAVYFPQLGNFVKSKIG